MKKEHTCRLRKAIAMIELIFALTIMGIVMMSAPMLINRSTQSSYIALQQESIAAAAAQMNMIMTAEWDELDTNTTIGEPVLRTASTTLNQCNSATDIYPSGVTSASGRYCLGKDGNYHNASATFGKDPDDILYYDDIDDYHDQNFSLSVYNGESYATYQGDYIDKNISVRSLVYYGDDAPKKANGTDSGGYKEKITFSNPFRSTLTTTTNIKLITVELSSTNRADELKAKRIRLSAFMCNIGAPADLISMKAAP
jgi:hypothetical protein